MSVPMPGDVTGGYGSGLTSGYRGCLIGIRECSVRDMISFCTITTMASTQGSSLLAILESCGLALVRTSQKQPTRNSAAAQLETAAITLLD